MDSHYHVLPRSALSSGIVGHSTRVRRVAAAIAGCRWGGDVERLGQLSLAAELHDVGKFMLSSELLNKTGPLDDVEWAAMRRHTIIGERVAARGTQIVQVIEAVRHHHERFDGGGYPDALVGERIPEFARIIAVADSYDAMTSYRPYRRTISPEQAVREIADHAGTQFDPYWADAFLEIIKGGKRHIELIGLVS